MKLIKKTIVALTLGLTVSAVYAAPSSNVAWDKATRDLVANGNVENGQKIAAGGCASCHGATGVAPSPGNPSTAGQLAAYTFKQLKDYKDMKRGFGLSMGMLMVTMAQAMSEQDMADVAAFYASQPLPDTKGSATAKPSLVSNGDGKRLLPPCQGCHGDDGEGRSINVAALKGQNSGYFKDTMNAYRSGKRKNDVYSRMRLIAKDLTDAEIEELATYYSSMK